MSILLEALRKSEKNQQAPEAPDIHKDDDANRLPESIPTGPLAVLLVLALFVSGWFVWNQYRLPEGVYQPPVTLAAGNSQRPAPQEQQQKPTEVNNQTNQQVDTKTTSNEGRPRTPVESYQDAIKKIAVKKPVSKPPATKPAKQKTVVASAPKPAKRPPPVAKSTKQQRHEELTPITYWELPDSVRADVPEIKFSVLVYSKNVDDRFVLINGQRLMQGDTVQPGLVVKEIRRDGVVFSYRLYQFLVER